MNVDKELLRIDGPVSQAEAREALALAAGHQVSDAAQALLVHISLMEAKRKMKHRQYTSSYAWSHRALVHAVGRDHPDCKKVEKGGLQRTQI